jgi:hypothetical protein
MPAPSSRPDLPLTAAQTASWEGATSILGDYLRRGYQCTPRDWVPYLAQDFTRY